ncbi:MAG: FKBP-type peptidyl-prolyl cis-trans isomerase, partial [Muribaculaceae bacterium]|nr:FKBP-type peptidyl-prolyl cis-trans isomerase [Muribaculaceae bacterium]
TAKITRRDVAQIKYTGRLVDGTVFDSSDDARLSPAGVVPGFAEGLQMLGKGGKATFYIPGDLAYGVDGAPRAGIGPNAMLIFDVEVLDVNPTVK